jgi:hypothetical protein
MTATTDTPVQTIQAAIAACISTGEPLAIDLATLLAASPLPNLPTAPVTVSFTRAGDPLQQLGLYRLATLFPGVPLAQWLPRDGMLSDLITNNDYVSLDEVGFQVSQAGGQLSLASLSVGVALGPNGAGWAIPTLGLPVTATLQQLDFRVAAPFASPSISATLSGQLTLGGALVLDVSLDCPSFVFTATEPAGSAPTLSALLTGLSVPSPASFSGLLVEGVQLSVMALDQAIDVQAQILTPDGAPYPKDSDFAFDSLSLSVDYSPAATTANIACNLILMQKIALGASLSTDGQAWTADAGLDVTGTWLLFNPGGQPPATPQVQLSQFLGAFSLPVPSFFSDIAILTLSGSATIPDTGPNSYSLDLVFDISWSLGVPVDVLTTVNVASISGAAPSGSIVGAIDIDGFNFTLEWDFGAQDSFTVSSPALGGLTGTYASGTVTLAIGEKQAVSLGDLIGDFIGLFTGDPYTALPDPWSLLNDIDVSDLSVAVDLSTKKVTVSCGFAFSFLGCSITGFGLSYDPSKPGGGSGFSFSLLGSFPMLPPAQQTSPSWDPTQPSQAPTAPSLGAAYFDILLAAIGQHVVLSPAPTTVEQALTEIAAIAGEITTDNPLPSSPFDQSAGWLVGARIVLLGQVDVRLVFADPEIYGVHVIVGDPIISGAPSFPWLDALKGLSAEILYRKVSDTVGVYEGFLTLPDSIRKIDMGAFELQLPSFSVAFYTNGDFMIDVGYPANGDFSNSVIISAAEFYGSGGILFGKLSQVSATGLPAIAMGPNNLPVGSFGTVIELGLGLQLGIYKSFSAGPMSASMGVLLQGMFMGVFSKFTTLPDSSGNQSSDQYYSVNASISIIGKLEGELDFVIVTASLLVEIVLSAGIVAIAHQHVTVPMSASVDVELTVTINCGLFKIHIHVGFSTTVSYTAKFGSDSTALWQETSAPRLMGAFMLAGSAPPTMTYAPLPCAALPLNLYVVPQLTRGLTDPSNPGSAAWTYIAQGALISPEAASPGVTLTQTNDALNANDFVALLTAWMIFDWQQANGGQPIPAQPTPQALYGLVTVAPADITGVTDYLNAVKAAGSGLPNSPQLQAFFAANVGLTGAVLPGAGEFGLAFFPLPPGTTVTSDDGPVPPADPNTVEGVLADYVLITVLAALHSAGQVLGSQTLTLSALFAAMAQTNAAGVSPLGSAVGQGTRFLLHGVRVNGLPLYTVTGQEAPIADLTKASMTLTVTAPDTSWGVTTPTGGLPVAVGIAPNATSGFVTNVDETGVAATPLVLGAVAPRHFTVSPGVGGAAAYVRGFPSVLKPFLNGRTAFKLQTISGSTVSDVPPSGYQWCSTVAFTVRKAPASGSTSAKPSWIPAVYALAAVQSDGLDTLEAIYRGAGVLAPSALELAYVQTTAGTQSLKLVEVPATANPPIFMFRSNISTETNPSPAMKFALRAALRAQTTTPDLDFLTNLMTGGLTNSGGYYLATPPGTLPDDLFDASGQAQLQLVVSFSVPQSGDGFDITNTINAVRVTNPTAGADPHLFVTADAITVLQATVPVGTVGLSVARPIPANPQSDPTYAASLNNLFNLLTCAPTAIRLANGAPVTLSNPPRDAFVTGPATDGQPTGIMAYNRLYNLLSLTGNAWPVDPADPSTPAQPIDPSVLLNLNPYMFNGGSVTVGYGWTDLYGDILPAALAPTTLNLGYTDPAGGLSDWPGLVYGYTVEGSPSARTLTLRRAWIPDPGAGSDPVRRANNLKRQYATLYHQLTDMAVQVTASFLTPPLTTPQGGQSTAALLQADIKAILNAIEAEQTTVLDLPAITFALPTGSAGYVTDPLAPLTSQTTFTRQGPVDPTFANDPSVRASTTALSPYDPTQSGVASTQSYRYFAAALEPALADLDMRVLVGDTDVPNGAKLWLMRYGASGISLGFDWTSAYAPPPFSTTLVSRAAIQSSINSQLPPDLQIPAVLVANQVDLDVAFGGFLAAMEQFLSPAYGVPAYSADPTAIARCLSVKDSMSQTLAHRVVSLNDGGAGAAEAIEVYRQACLIDLTNYYAVDAVAQFGLTTTLGGPSLSQPLDVYGRAVGSGGTPDVTVSPGKAVLSGTSPIAFSLDAQHKGERAESLLPTSFQIDAFETVSGSISVPSPDGGTDTYVTGTWLRFVTAGVGLVDLPGQPVKLPLRAYPRAPIITGQTFSVIPVNHPGPNKLMQADEWSLDLSYNHPFVAQDTMEFTATLNIAPPSGLHLMSRAGDPTDDLLDTLTQFGALYGMLIPTFQQMRDGKQPAGLTDALNAFADIAEAVAASITVPLKVQPYVNLGGGTGGEPTGTDFTFALVESFDDTKTPDQAPWVLTITPSPDNQPIGDWTCPPPVMKIGPFTSTLNKDGTYGFVNGEATLMADQAMQITNRTVSATPLSIIDHHNGRCALSILRNAAIGLPTAFQYTTPVIQAVDKVLPFISHVFWPTFDIRTLPGSTSGPATTMSDAFNRLYVNLVAGVTGVNLGDAAGTVQTEISLTFPVQEGAHPFGLPDRSVPLLMALPTPIPFHATSAQVAELAQAMTTALVNWRNANGLPSSVNAKLQIAVSLFSTASETGMPIVELDGLVIPCGGVSWT